MYVLHVNMKMLLNLSEGGYWTMGSNFGENLNFSTSQSVGISYSFRM